MVNTVERQSSRASNEGSGLLERCGRSSARHPFRVLIVWLIVLVAVLGGKKAVGAIFSDNVNLSGTQAYAGLTLLSQNDKAASGYSGLVVVHARSGTLSPDSSAVARSVTSLSRMPDVLSVSNPLAPGSLALSRTKTTAYINVQFSVLPKTLGSSYVGRLNAATASLRAAGLEVEYGGGLDQLTRPASSDLRSEAIGFIVALVVLLVGFGSILGATLPLLTAIGSVAIGLSLLGIVAAVITFGTASPTLAVMIGLGVGIDYSVFLTTRFRQLISNGFDPVVAAGRTVATSGHAVLIAATSVSVALFGLYASGITFIGQLGFAAVFGVVTAAVGAVTLVPAGLALAGTKIDRWTVRKAVAESSSDGSDGWSRYAKSVGRRPWSYLFVGVAILGVLAIPLFSIQIGHVGDGADPTSYTDKRAYDLIASAFGAGANGPLTLVIDVRHAHNASAVARSVASAISSTPDIAQASPLQPTSDHALLVGKIVPSSGPQNEATTTLFNRLVDTTLPEALQGSGAIGYVTGGTASQIQFAASLSSRLPLIIAIVVAMAFILILMSFRSLLLAVKAAVLNLLSIGAAYGVVVAVFQWGWGRSLLGVSENVPIESYVPMIMFAIVFGLSMDYEVFLLSRVREHWDESHNNGRAVEVGLSDTARVITCAALIMVSVFAAFVGSTDVVIKMLGVGLAASVLIDATIVRLLLVPAVMNIFGSACWYFPTFLDRIVPHVAVEGRSWDADEDLESSLPVGDATGHGSALH